MSTPQVVIDFVSGVYMGGVEFTAEFPSWGYNVNSVDIKYSFPISSVTLSKYIGAGKIIITGILTPEKTVPVLPTYTVDGSTVTLYYLKCAN